MWGYGGTSLQEATSIQVGTKLPNSWGSILFEMKELTLRNKSGFSAASLYTLYVTLEAGLRPSWSFQNGASKFDWLILTSDVGNCSCAVPRKRGGVPTVNMPFVQTCMRKNKYIKSFMKTMYECECVCVRACVCGRSNWPFNSHECIGVFLLQKECQCPSKSAVNIHHHYQTLPQHHRGR